MEKERLIYSISDLAAELGHTSKSVWYHVRTSGNIPEPTIQKGRRSFYTKADVAQILDAYHRAGNSLRFITEYLSEPQ